MGLPHLVSMKYFNRYSPITFQTWHCALKKTKSQKEHNKQYDSKSELTLLQKEVRGTIHVTKTKESLPRHWLMEQEWCLLVSWNLLALREMCAACLAST